MPQSHKTAREQLDWIQATIGTDCQQAICAGAVPTVTALSPLCECTQCCFNVLEDHIVGERVCVHGTGGALMAILAKVRVPGSLSTL